MQFAVAGASNAIHTLTLLTRTLLTLTVLNLTLLTLTLLTLTLALVTGSEIMCSESFRKIDKIILRAQSGRKHFYPSGPWPSSSLVRA